MDLIRTFYSELALTPQELTAITEKHEAITVKKGDFILTKGQVSNAYYLIEYGLTRSFLHDYEGNEVTISFCTDNDVVIEVASFFQRHPTVENIQALMETRLWKIKFEDFQELFHQIPEFREWGRSWMAKELVPLFALDKRKTNIDTAGTTQAYCFLPGHHRHFPKPHPERNCPRKLNRGNAQRTTFLNLALRQDF